jgi:hypothetical protein
MQIYIKICQTGGEIQMRGSQSWPRQVAIPVARSSGLKARLTEHLFQKP